MDREPPTLLARPPRREPRRLGVYRVRGVDAYLGAYPLGQPLAQLAYLVDYELDGLLGRAELVREELGVDGPGESRLGELRQALPVGRGLRHEGSTCLYGLSGRIAGRLGRPGLLLRQALYELREPSRERAALRRVAPPEAQVGVGIDGPRDDGVAGEEAELGVSTLPPDVFERTDGGDASVADEDRPVPDRWPGDGHEQARREDRGFSLRHPFRPLPKR